MRFQQSRRVAKAVIAKAAIAEAVKDLSSSGSNTFWQAMINDMSCLKFKTPVSLNLT